MEPEISQFQRWLQLAASLMVILGPVIYVSLKKFFPDRSETITPAQLQGAIDRMGREQKEAIAAVDHNTRDAFSRELGLLRVSINEQFEHVEKAMTNVEEQAKEALKLAGDANHAAELVTQKQVSDTALLVEKIDNIKTSISLLSLFDTKTKPRRPQP